MAPKDSKAGELERKASTRRSARVSLDDGNDGDDLALESTIADGFRPTHASGSGTPSVTSGTSARSAPSTPPLTSASSTTLVSREDPASPATSGGSSSTGKPQAPQFSLLVQGEANSLNRQITNSTGSSVYIPHDGPYRGPSAASHPYHLYTQSVRPARTLSMGTSSTVPLSESSYRGPTGPSHPYGLYPQVDSIEADAAQAAIPLGFRGLPDQYQRRVGPEGEEIGDIIGPDGHTEQLPPYTRYPDEAYVRKAAAVEGCPGLVHGAATALPPILTSSASTIPPLDGAGGIGLATRNPEFESTDDPGSPGSRHSTRSFRSDDSRRGIRMDDEGLSEKREPPKKWQAWMRRKACGIIPYWAICLTAIILLVMLVALGVVVGTVLSNNNKQKPPPPWEQGDWKPPSDVTPIPTPTDLQPLATGTFGLPLLTNRVSNTCLKNPTLSMAWNCHIVLSGMTLNVTKENKDYRASLDCNHALTSKGNTYAYGEQPPLLEKPVKLKLVQDNFEAGRGPAWYKRVKYTKTVILPEGWLESDQDPIALKRAPYTATIGASMPDFKRKGIAQPGDKPWICTWPDTWLELFIYAQQNSSFANWPPEPPPPSSTAGNSSSTPSTPPPSSSPSTSTDGPDSSSEKGSHRFQDGHKTDDADSWDMSYHSLEIHARSEGAGPTTPPPDTASTTVEATSTWNTATASDPFGPIDTGSDFPHIAQPYPRVVKLEERRMWTKDAPRAQCTQVQIMGPGQEAQPLQRPDGKLVVMDIEEVGPFGGGSPEGEFPDKKMTDGVWERSDWEEDEDDWEQAVGDGEEFGIDGLPDISPCGCMWFLT
ncbi:hypothetical protein MYCTH_2111125 [Thermothelomyces thermophilus ATCC 42464]|uniref:DUF7820 domain-containing protein n=1 Tax=Thermothelomyces thermophilus (strain ATCC 42464 / BCRC 31852 / DSM 1799) TaxID=573729 RepID=G2QHK4_THET4|nr:uncharacterized protein MYCTH_2111125 [Thermothelomyces thermophilus ATCC 42464]AEO58864.1 hypothetical protein MYCTH_2111125 [Thermothelomyces thermophilus ATCC 42464]